MSENKKNSAGFLAGFFLFLLNLGTIAATIFSLKHPQLALPALLLFIITGAFRAYARGTLAEMLSIGRIVCAFAAGWFLRGQLQPILPLKGILGEIGGFYGIFFLVYLVSGQGIALALKNHQPSMTSKVLGAFIGSFEGLLIGMLVMVALSMVPGSSLADNQPEIIKFIGGSTEKIVAPVLPDQARNAVRAVKTMTRLSQGIDPEKVDGKTIVEVMKPLAEMPEVVEIQNNPEIQHLIQQRDIAGLIKHPAMQKLMENPNLQQKMLDLDWKRLERALGENEIHEP